jgi:hypothetical protein
MKAKFVMIFVLVVAFAGMARASEWPAACGKDTVQFKVKTDKKQSPPADPEPGKAQIIFVEAVKGAFGAAPTARYGVDGAWVGANHGASYFVVSVDPGEHHLCANWQSSVRSEKEEVGIDTVNLQTGKVYYYEFKIVRTEVGSPRRGGAAGLPNNLNMDVKDPPTVDSVEFTILDEDLGRSRLKVTPGSTFVVKQ